MFVGQLVVVITIILIGKGESFPLNLLQNPKVPSPKVLDFLKKFGYIEEDDANSGALYTESGIAETIKIVQKYGALEETGILDNATLTLMTSPRCGVPDIIRKKRSKRYVLGPQGWNKRTISYFIANWSPKLGEHSVTKNIQLALDTWGKYGRLTFRRSMTPDADIIVAFGSSYHGDNFPFDGQGNILAHAFFPYEDGGFGGDIHFDADENWTDSKEEAKTYGMDFATVALHELGHSLGLSHSVAPDSVMFPYYRGYEGENQLQLGYDDILGMYELYIRRNIKDDNWQPETATSKKQTSETTLFTNPSTATSTTSTRPETTTYWTSRTRYYPETTSRTRYYPETTMYPTSRTPETRRRTHYYPETTTNYDKTTIIVSTNSSVNYEGDNEEVHIHMDHDTTHNIPSTNSPSLPNICDGRFDAVAVLRGEIFIFKEQYVWRLKEMGKTEPGYPILIRNMFPDLPETIKKIDAAYERSDGMIVLFSGDKFWVYNGKIFVEDSPKHLSFYGLPSTIDKIDAVQVWARNGKVYFYKQDRFWRYNETVKAMDEGYPRHMERWRGVPHNLDAAATFRGITYFFKDELYWKFDNEWVKVTEQSPLPSPQLWLGCPEDIRTLSRL